MASSQAEEFWLLGVLVAVGQAQATPQNISRQSSASVTGSTYQGIYLLRDALPRGWLQAGRQEEAEGEKKTGEREGERD